MTRAEALAFVIAPMTAGRARQMVRQALLDWPDADVAEWHRRKDAERKREKRGAVRSGENPPTGQCPVSHEGADRKMSGSPSDDQPDTVAVPPMVSPAPPSFPPHPHPRTRGQASQSVPIPASLSAVSGFETEWNDFAAHRREIRKPLTPIAADRLLKSLAKRPADAIAALDLAMSQSWRGFRWQWFDKENSESTPNPHNRNAAHQQSLPFQRGHVDRNAGTVNARRSGQYAGLGTVFTGRKA